MIVKLKDVKKKYEKFDLNVSLSIQEGMITGLIGQNGSGKSTTFKSLLNLIELDSGQIEIFNQPLNSLSITDKEKIGVVLSDSFFSEYYTIQDISLLLKNMYRHFDEETFKKRIHDFNLPFNQAIKSFSTGMKAKLKIICALSYQAQLLILDEPTAGLDVVARDEILDLLRNFMLENEKNAILISSHISTDLENLCDDIYLIHNGRIRLHEQIDEIREQYAILKVSEQEYQQLDHTYLLKIKKENYGYACLTSQRQFYQENYPKIVIEKATIDDVLLMNIRGENL